MRNARSLVELLIATMVAALVVFIDAPMAGAAAKAAGQNTPVPSAVPQKQALRPEKIQFHHQYGTAEIVSGRFVTSSAAQTKLGKAFLFFAGKQDAFKIAQPENELQLLAERTDELGLTHLRFQQVYDGIEVWGCQTIVHFEDHQTIYLVGGQTIATPQISTLSAISEAEAAAEAMASLKDEYPLAELETETKLVIYPNEGDPRLAQLVTVTRPSTGQVRYRVFIDAQTGQVLHKFNDIHYDGPDTGSGPDVLGVNRTFPIWRNDSPLEYQLYDGTRALAGIVTYEDFYEGGPMSTDPDDDKTWDDNPAQKAAVAGHFFAGIAYDYFLGHHGRDSFDGGGGQVLVNVHAGTDWNNATWNGEVFSFGDGDEINYLPFSGSLDVVAHEFTHAVTEYNGLGGLIYQFQSGALNEHYSDFFGAMVDSNDTEWLVGEDIKLAAPGFLRSMKDPNLAGHPKHMDDYRNMGIWEDNGGVHVNSGIPNHLAYRFIDVYGNLRETTENIWYRTLTTYLTPNSSFYFWAGMTAQSALDLYGPNTSPQCLTLDLVLGEVGLGTGYAEPWTIEMGVMLGGSPDIASVRIQVPVSYAGIDHLINNWEAPDLPGMSFSSGPSVDPIPDGSFSEFELFADPTGLGECDLGTHLDSARFDIEGPFFSYTIKVPVTLSIGRSTTTKQYENVSNGCIDFDVINTTVMPWFRRDGINTLYDGSFMVGLIDGEDTIVYRDVFSAERWAPVDLIDNSTPGRRSFRIASEDARIQGEVTYRWPTVSDADSCGFFILEYLLTNPCDTELYIRAGLYCDFDIDDEMANRGGYVLGWQDGAEYVYMTNSTDTRACGLALIDHHTAYGYQKARTIHNPTQVWDDAFTDQVAYDELRGGGNTKGLTDDDWSILLKTGGSYLDPGDSFRYEYAVLYSNTGSSDLGQLLDRAKAWAAEPPQLVYVLPFNYAFPFPDPLIVALFDHPMDAATLTNTSFVVNSLTRGGVTGSFQTWSNDFTVRIEADEFSGTYGDLFTCVLTTDLESQYGDPLARSYVWQFPIRAAAGSGNFDPAADYDNGGFAPYGICAADFDGDGLVDLAMANRSDDLVTILMNDGNGFVRSVPDLSSVDGPNRIVAADFDRDGNLDLVTTNADAKISIYAGNGDGTFLSPVVWPAGLYTYDLVAGDFDGDGYMDLATANLDGSSVSVFKNFSGAIFLSTEYGLPSTPWSIATGDLDNDYDLDIVAVLAESNEIAVLLNYGDGMFTSYTTYPTGGFPIGSSVADLNGDKYLDIVTADADSADVAILLNDGDGTFTGTDTRYPVGDSPWAVSAADMDADRDLDLVVANYGSANVSVLMNDGNGVFAPQTVFAVGTGPRHIVTADFDTNGSIDIATPNRSSNNVSVLLNSSCACGGPSPSFGDINCDTEVNPADVVFMVNYVYKSIDQRCGDGCCTGWACPNPTGDVNCDMAVNPQDVVFYVNYVYKNITPFPCDPCE